VRRRDPDRLAARALDDREERPVGYE